MEMLKVKVLASLNPFFNGICSVSPIMKDIFLLNAFSVLILFLMEYAL